MRTQRFAAAWMIAAGLFVAALAHAGHPASGLLTYELRQGVAGFAGWEDTSVRWGNTTRNYGGDDSLALAPIAAGVYGEAIILLKCDFVPSLPPDFVCTRAFVGIYKHTTNGEPAIVDILDKIVWVYRCMFAWTEGNGEGMNINTGNYGGNTSGATADAPLAGGTGTWGGGVDSNGGKSPFKRTGTEATNDTSSVGAAGYWGTDQEFNGAGMTSGENIPSEPEAEFYLRTKKTPPPASAAIDNFGMHIFEVSHFVNLVLSGAAENNGWVLTNSTVNLTLPSFIASSENDRVTYRPIMWIEGYVVGSGSVGSGFAGWTGLGISN